MFRMRYLMAACCALLCTVQVKAQGAVVPIEPVSVARDALCERLFEPTGPLELVQESVKGVLQSLLGTLTTALQQGTGSQTPKSSELANHFGRLARTTTWLPVEAEEWLGEAMLEKVSTVPPHEELEGRYARDYERIRNLFRRLVEALPSDQAYKFRLVFSPIPSTNLTTMPGGIIIANAGLLRQAEALVTALLAHEIAHVTKRHYTRQIQGYLADTLTVGEVLSALSRPQQSRDRWITWGRGIVTLEQLFTRFYADQELEADACIPRLVKAAGLPYEPPFRAFQLWALGSNTTATGEGEDRRFFELRHPAGPDRQAILERSFVYWEARQARMLSAGAGSTRLGGQAPEARSPSESTGPDPASGPTGAAGAGNSTPVARGGALLGGLLDRLRKPAEGAVEGPPPRVSPFTTGQ